MRNSVASAISACAGEDVRAAVAALADRGRPVQARGLAPLGAEDGPGLYSWWVDASGAEALTASLAEPLMPGLIYAGQTGATRWPSGRRGCRTLDQRIRGDHLRGRTRGSTFRWTLAATLRDALHLTVVGRRQITAPSEAHLSAWMLEHLSIIRVPFANRDRLGDLERRVLERLDPPLNLEGMEPTPLRAALRDRRRWVP